MIFLLDIWAGLIFTDNTKSPPTPVLQTLHPAEEP
jgi:hypothetical protein